MQPRIEAILNNFPPLIAAFGGSPECVAVLREQVATMQAVSGLSEAEAGQLAVALKSLCPETPGDAPRI